MTEENRIEYERQLIQTAKRDGKVAKTYFKLSGPGWLQSAITLGGGSLSGALFLGILGGFSLLWLQLIAIILGIVMLSAISYVTLSIKERPFHAINKNISPVLGWGWALATLMANMVWCLPQFSLSTAVVQQNLLPGLLGAESSVGTTGGKIIISLLLLTVAVFIVWQSGSKGKGIKVFEILLKILVGVVVICFVGVVVKLAFTGTGLPWGEIIRGYIPDLSQFKKPAESLIPYIQNVDSSFQAFWSDQVVDMQRNVMIAAAAAAVGINMTFLLPYSMLSRGWDKDFRGLAIFDLSFGMLVPFLLVTSCVVIASSTQFHGKPGVGLLDPNVPAPANLLAGYHKNLDSRLKFEYADAFGSWSPEELQSKREKLPQADKEMAAMLVKRDAFNLAQTLAPLTGSTVANIIFGVGVLGMGLSTIIVLMLISGYVVCEVFNFPQGGNAHRWGSMLAAVGVLGPFVWSGKTAFWLAVPTSVFGMILLPIAYVTFFLMMNSKKILGDSLPKGWSRIRWNVLMGAAILGAGVAASWAIWNKAGLVGVAVVVVFVLAAWFLRKKETV